MKNYETKALIILITLLFACGAALVLGQGGTGRETPKPSPPAPPPARPTGPTRNLPASNRSPCSAQSPTQATGRTHTVNLNGASLEMVEIPAGSFCMGATAKVVASYESPKHGVTLRSIYIGKYEVTQAQWQAEIGNNPSHFKGE